MVGHLLQKRYQLGCEAPGGVSSSTSRTKDKLWPILYLLGFTGRKRVDHHAVVDFVPLCLELEVMLLGEDPSSLGVGGKQVLFA